MPLPRPNLLLLLTRAGIAAGSLAMLAACGGGGSGSYFPAPGAPAAVVPPPSQPEQPAQPPAATRKVGGTLSGFASGGGRIVLQNNGGDDLRLTADGRFSFAAPVSEGGAYEVTVRTQPLWQFCTVNNGSGTAGAAMPELTVNCEAAQAVVTTLAGSGTAGTADGEGTAAQFNLPSGVTVDADGHLYVTDAASDRVRKVSPSGTVTTLPGSAAAGLEAPQSPILDAAGNLYVAEYGGHKVRKFAPDGSVSTVAGSGSAGSTDGNGTGASFNRPLGLVLDPQGNLFVSEPANHGIRKIAPNGDVTTFAGAGQSGFADGTGTGAFFNRPAYMAMDAAGNLFVADAGNHVIRKITPEGVVTTPYGMPQQRGSADGVGNAASFNFPNGLAIDSGGSLYAADYTGRVIRRITPDGMVSTLAGTAGQSGAQDGVGAAASFDGPYALAVDALGHVYVIDYVGHRIRKITPTPAP